MTSIRTALIAALLLPLVHAPAAAQSLFSTRGLGVPVAPLDARATALGGIGVGLTGFHTSMGNPAELSGVSRRGVSAALQPVNSSTDVAGAEDGTAASRFPLIRLIYPVTPRLVAAAGYGSYLEQSWAVMTESTRTIGGEDVAVTDLLRSRGGIAQARVSAAYALSPTLSLGAAAGLLTGNVERTAARSFADSAGRMRSFQEQLRWRYSAPIASVGVRWDVADVLRLGASVMAGGDLVATGSGGAAEDREYGAPLEVSGGASLRVARVLLATAGAVWARPPATGGETVSRETLRVGGGVEYQGVRSGQRTYPIRLGARWAQLPYHLSGESAATEWSAGAGIGFRIGDPRDPAAVADIGLERGARSGLAGGAVAAGVQERLWRFSVSLSLFAR